MKQLALLCSSLVFLVLNSFAADQAADEKAIRDLVRQQDEGRIATQVTEKAIHVSDRLARPVIGWKPSKPEELKARDERMGRPNQKTTREILRLVVSKSGDMAEEFGNFTISWDGPDKKKVSFEGSYLRVWHKVDGGWKIDASFHRPNREAE